MIRATNSRVVERADEGIAWIGRQLFSRLIVRLLSILGDMSVVIHFMR